MEVDRFADKLNKIDGNTYVVEEKAVLENGVYEAELQHDNINENTLSVYTGSKLTGIRIGTYSLSTPSLAPWKRIIRIYADVPEVYISYETDGDTVEADDINLVQNAITATQEALNEEDSRAKLAENGLEEDIASEVARAKAAEEKLTGDIRGEVVRAEGKESEISTKLNNEIVRASQAEENIQYSINVNKPIWDDKYTRNEVDNKLSMLETNIDWKEAVDTYDDIATAYPNPEDGWTVNVKDTDYTYRYNGSEWVAISANAIPKATDSVDGLLSKEDRAKYESAFTHISDTAKHIKADERTAWNAAKNHAESAHAPIDAQVNVIETIKVNGTALTPSEKEVDIDIPTYASDSIAGIVKPKEIYVNQTDGTLELTRRTEEPALLNSYAGRVKINEIKGRSEQFTGTITDESGSDVTVPNPDYPQEIKSVSGKNLLDCSGLTEQISNGVTFTPVYDDNGNLLYVNANGTATENANFTLTNNYMENSDNQHILSGCPSDGSSTTYYLTYMEWDSSWTTVNGVDDIGNGIALPHSENAAYSRVTIAVRNGTTVNNLKFHPMIRKTSIPDSTYVPYGCLRIKTTAAQLFDSTKAQDSMYQNCSINSGNFNISKNENFWITGLIQVKPNTQYTCSHKVARGAFYSDENTPIKTTIVESNVATFTTPAGCHFVNLNLVKGIYPFGTAVMLNEGDISLPWQPYQSSFITLSSPITLNGIGDVKDRIVKKDGVWGVERKFIKKEFASDDAWRLSSSANYIYLSSIMLECSPNTDAIKANLLSNYAVCTAYEDLLNGVVDYAVAINESGTFGLRIKDCTTLEEYMTYLKKTPLMVVAEKNDFSFEPLPASDQIALSSLESFDTVTYLDVDSEVQPSWDVEYGTSRVGGYTLEALNMARINEVRISELTSATLMLNQE